VNLGTIHYHLHKFKEAADYYQKAVEVDPRYPLAHFNLGNLRDEQGRTEEAFQHYGTALVNPDYADAHYNVALLCEQTGDFLKATKHWKAYLKVDGSSAWANIARRQLEKLRKITVVSK
jgi:tetratricopeptide (TPR) repeat protein